MRKNKHAVALGRNGGKATARKLTKPERIASAKHAAMKRWERRKWHVGESGSIDLMNTGER